MVKLIALKPIRYAGKMHYAEEEFEARRRDAKLFVLLRKAEYATKALTPAPEPESEISTSEPEPIAPSFDTPAPAAPAKRARKKKPAPAGDNAPTRRTYRRRDLRAESDAS